MKKQSISTFLPIFNGFYNTIFDSTSQIDNEVYSINQERKDRGLSQIDYEALRFDNSNYEIAVSKELCKILESELSDYVTKIAYESLKKPKTYNFSNDSIDVIIEPKVKAIKSFIYANIEDYKTYLKKRYTSYDGFYSWYNNNFDSWKTDTNDFTNFSKNEHILGSILEFIAIKEGITEYTLYENLEVYVTEFIENYQSLLDLPSCNKCNNIIEDKEVLKAKDKYFKIMNKNCTCLCTDCLNLVYA